MISRLHILTPNSAGLYSVSRVTTQNRPRSTDSFEYIRLLEKSKKLHLISSRNFQNWMLDYLIQQISTSYVTDIMHVRNDTPTSSSQFTIHTSLLFDSKAKTFVENVSIGINKKSGLVTSVQTREASSPLFVGPEDLDLRGLTVLPGLSDSHTHIFLHAYKEVSSINQERDESLPERILRAGNHLRAALKAGYTTYRDLGTEGVGSLDTGVRDAVNRGIIPGPRLFVATEALASSGGYEVRIEGGSQGTIAPRISDPCDGIYGVTAGVRRRLAAGADVIKFYADYRKRALRFPVGSWPGSLPIMHPPGM